jgi:hypothetical protein
MIEDVSNVKAIAWQRQIVRIDENSTLELGAPVPLKRSGEGK